MPNMHNTISVMLIFSLLLVSVNAIAIIEPIAVSIENNQELIIGNASPGQTIKFVIARICEGVEYESINVTNIPEDWHYSIEKTTEFFSLTIKIPSSVSERMQRIGIELEAKQPLKQEKGFIIINIRKNLLDFAARELTKETAVNREACYKFTAINNSIANEGIGFSTSLPANWVKQSKAIAKKNSATDFSVCVIPRASGVTRFKIKLFGKDSLASKEFELVVKAKPEFLAKILMPIYAMPIMLPSMMQSYLLNALAVAIFKFA